MAIDVAAVEEKVDEVEYFFHGVLTICALKADNGFYTVGYSAPVNPAEYNEDVGKQFAYKMAFDKLVAHEAYYQKESAFIEGLVDEIFGDEQVGDDMSEFEDSDDPMPVGVEPDYPTKPCDTE